MKISDLGMVLTDTSRFIAVKISLRIHKQTLSLGILLGFMKDTNE